jgi:hypothetical protein
MSSPRYALRATLAIATALLLAACAQHGGSVLPASPQAAALPDLSPPDCKGQQNEQDYATLTASLSTSGGSFCIPAYGGFGGKLKYPSVSPSIKLTLSTSTENYNNQPILGSGSPLFFLEFSTSGATTFGRKLKAGGGLTGSEIVKGQPYTAYGRASLYGYKITLGPCYAVATKGKYGGVIGGLGSLIKGESIPFAVSGVIEVYSGRQTSTKC